MKSKITIDVNWANEPVIKIQYVESEDLRDKMVKRYLERLGHKSEWCEVTFEPTYGESSSIAIIQTITPPDLPRAMQWMRQVCDTKEKEESIYLRVENDSNPLESLMENIIKKLQDAGMQDAVDVIYPKIVDIIQQNDSSIEQ